VNWLTAAIAAVLVFEPACSRTKPLPELPAIDLSRFRGEPRDAIAKSLAAAQARAGNVDAVFELAAVLHAHEQFQAASRAYSRAYALDPARFATLYCWSHALASEGDYASAAGRLREALRLRAGSVPALLKLGEVLRESGAVRESAAVYKRVLNTNPREARAHYGLGRASTGEEAIAEYREALELFPRFGAAQFALAAAYRKTGEETKAEEILRNYERDKTLLPPLDDPEMRAVRALNVSAGILLQRASEEEMEGRLLEAVSLYERAVASDPSLVQAHVDLISLYGRLQRERDAESAYQKAVVLNPNLAGAHYNYGVLCFARSRFPEAKAAFERAITLQPSHAEALHNLGVILEQEGKWDQAATFYRRAVEARSEYPLAHFHLGRIYANQSKYPLAIHEFERSLQPATESTPAYLYALAATHARAGNRARAAELMRDARNQAAARGQQTVVASIDRDLARIEGKP
jgi:superkiller protein 3